MNLTQGEWKRDGDCERARGGESLFVEAFSSYIFFFNMRLLTLQVARVVPHVQCAICNMLHPAHHPLDPRAPAANAFANLIASLSSGAVSFAPRFNGCSLKQMLST